MEVKTVELLPMNEAEACPDRRVIDEAAAAALGVPAETIADWRHRLAVEPTVSNRDVPTACRSHRARDNRREKVRGPRAMAK